jgi:Phage integrase family
MKLRNTAIACFLGNPESGRLRRYRAHRRTAILPCRLFVLAKSHLRVVAPTEVKRTVAPKRAKNAELRTREHFTPDEVEALMEAARGNRYGHRDATMILLTYRHGLRAAEVCDLRWDQIDFNGGCWSHLSLMALFDIASGPLWYYDARRIEQEAATRPGDSLPERIGRSGLGEGPAVLFGDTK